METFQNIIPLKYFQDLLEKDKSPQLIKEFISDFVENSGETNFEIDHSNGIITYYGCYYDDKGDPTEADFITTEFKLFFEALVQKQFEESKYQLQSVISELACLDKTYYPFLDLQKKELNSLISETQNKYIDYPFIGNKLQELLNFIDKYVVGDVRGTHNSYCLNPEIDQNKLQTLFNLLKNISIIDSSENEFINAFTSREVKYGIKWLDKAKSGDLNKQSIFYLIEKLIDQKIILVVANNNYNKKIEYVFRDHDGNPLKYIRQSKRTFFESNYNNDIIDDIIGSL